MTKCATVCRPAGFLPLDRLRPTDFSPLNGRIAWHVGLVGKAVTGHLDSSSNPPVSHQLLSAPVVVNHDPSRMEGPHRLPSPPSLAGLPASLLPRDILEPSPEPFPLAQTPWSLRHIVHSVGTRTHTPSWGAGCPGPRGSSSPHARASGAGRELCEAGGLPPRLLCGPRLQSSRRRPLAGVKSVSLLVGRLREPEEGWERVRGCSGHTHACVHACVFTRVRCMCMHTCVS